MMLSTSVGLWALVLLFFCLIALGAVLVLAVWAIVRRSRRQTCPACGKPLQPQYTVCPYCGAPVKRREEK